VLPPWLALTAVLVVDALLTGRWGWAVGVVVLLMLPLASSRRGRRAAEQGSTAAGEWDPERVAAAVQGAGDRHIAVVKALREADPRLSLLDADRLVREHARG